MKLVLTIWFFNFENYIYIYIYIYIYKVKRTIYILPTQLYNRRSKCSYSIEKKKYSWVMVQTDNKTFTLSANVEKLFKANPLLCLSLLMKYLQPAELILQYLQ